EYSASVLRKSWKVNRGSTIDECIGCASLPLATGASLRVSMEQMQFSHCYTATPTTVVILAKPSATQSSDGSGSSSTTVTVQISVVVFEAAVHLRETSHLVAQIIVVK